VSSERPSRRGGVLVGRLVLRRGSRSRWRGRDQRGAAGAAAPRRPPIWRCGPQTCLGCCSTMRRSRIGSRRN